MRDLSESKGVLGWVTDLIAQPRVGLIAVVAVGGVLLLAWIQLRANRDRRRYYREREKLRRDYWGWG